jgi:hypothetical protein
MTPALPFLALGLAPLWDQWRTTGRIVLAAGWIWGTTLTLVAVSTTPQPPASIERPVPELLWPAFRAGDLALNTQGFNDFRASEPDIRQHTGNKAGWNLGMKMRLAGLPSLIPLGILWLGSALWFFTDATARAGAKHRTAPTGPPEPRGSG